MKELLDRYEQLEVMKESSGTKTVLKLYIEGLEQRLIKKMQEK